MLQFCLFFDSQECSECPEEIFKKLLSRTIYLYDNFENTFFKSQIYDVSNVTFVLFLSNEKTFSTFADVSL